jgi:hypothetical protein
MATGTKVTWLDNVSKFFTQYDVIQMSLQNLPFQLDLSDYASVKQYAENIAGAVATNMPMNETPWPAAQRAAFDEWRNSGFWYSQTERHPPAPPPPDPALDDFIALSSALTGFDLTQDMDRLHPAKEVGSYYLGRIRGGSGGGDLDALIAAWNAAPSSLANLVGGAQYGALCQQIILLWYTSAIIDPVKGTFDFGTPDDNQYPTGLMWRAAQAHPMGYSIEQFGHWTLQPQGTSRTGLGSGD